MLFRHGGGVSICVAGCQKRELKAGLCIVLQSSQSIQAKMKWENHKSFMHKLAALWCPLCLD